MRGAADLLGALPAAFAGPVDYSPIWKVLAAVAVVAVVLWVVGVLWATRERRRPVRRATSIGIDAHRREALTAIDALARAVADRQVTTRNAASRLSVIVREFVGAATGLAVRTMTLEDIRRSQVPHLPELVTVLYPTEFGRHEVDDMAPLLQRGRELVDTWR